MKTTAHARRSGPISWSTYRQVHTPEIWSVHDQCGRNKASRQPKPDGISARNWTHHGCRARARLCRRSRPSHRRGAGPGGGIDRLDVVSGVVTRRSVILCVFHPVCSASARTDSQNYPCNHCLVLRVFSSSEVRWVRWDSDNEAAKSKAACWHTGC